MKKLDSMEKARGIHFCCTPNGQGNSNQNTICNRRHFQQKRQFLIDHSMWAEMTSRFRTYCKFLITLNSLLRTPTFSIHVEICVKINQNISETFEFLFALKKNLKSMVFKFYQS